MAGGQGFGFRVSGLGTGVEGFGFRDSDRLVTGGQGMGFGISGLRGFALGSKGSGFVFLVAGG